MKIEIFNIHQPVGSRLARKKLVDLHKPIDANFHFKFEYLNSLAHYSSVNSRNYIYMKENRDAPNIQVTELVSED